MLSRAGITFGYIMSGGTAVNGANQIANKGTVEVIEETHAWMAYTHHLPEIALIIGIIGTISTMFFQWRNYKNIRHMDKTNTKHHKHHEEDEHDDE